MSTKTKQKACRRRPYRFTEKDWEMLGSMVGVNGGDLSWKTSGHQLLSSPKRPYKKLAAHVRAADKVKNIDGKPKALFTLWWNADGSAFIWPAKGKKYAIIKRGALEHLAKSMMKHARSSDRA